MFWPDENPPTGSMLLGFLGIPDKRLSGNGVGDERGLMQGLIVGALGLHAHLSQETELSVRGLEVRVLGLGGQGILGSGVWHVRPDLKRLG